MAAGRTVRSLVGRRRRVGDEGEDEEGPVIVDDSQSEGSILSDMDDEDASSLAAGGAAASGAGSGGEVKPEGSASNGVKSTKKARKPRKKGKKPKEQQEEQLDADVPQTSFKAMADTDAMMHGLRIDDEAQAQEAVDFESMERNGATAPVSSAPPPTNGHPETLGQRQRQEHEEYRRKRDADPAFVPNRGNFFMHDTRGHQNGQAVQNMRGGFAGRGRGRGGPIMGGPFSPANQMAQTERSAEQPWKHDLHETINEENAFSAPQPTVSLQQSEQDDSARLFPKPAPPPLGHTQPRTINFSSTTLVGKVQIRVILPGMKAPIVFSEVPWKHYVRLPNHRPPIRRDKPVRVSLPDRPPHYIFPSTDRSFIFIPRQQRPNQPGYHRGSYQRNVGGHGGHGGYSSRRTSVYGGSVYASSIAASRRSSMAGISRADAFSPTSFVSGMPPPNRPVVRLPYGAQPFSGMTTPSGPLSGQHTPIGMPQIHTYPLPQQPTYQGTPTSTMHQPRPQKTISVTGIESPALLQQVPSNEPQPFESQLPVHMAAPPAFALPQQQQQPPYFSPQHQYAYPQQPQAGTPLSGIPEQAMHAQAFQPSMPYAQQPYYAPQPYPPQQQQYYYSPPTAPDAYAPMGMYMPPPQGYPMMPPPPSAHHQQAQQHPPQAQQHQHQQPPPQDQPSQPPPDPQQQEPSSTQSGMLAHESNGMVFYVPRSEVPQEQDQSSGGQQQSYQPAESFVPSYAMPGLPPPTPAPEAMSAGVGGYYYAPPQGMGQGMFYSGQQTQ